MDMLNKLCSLNGISGEEHEVREFILNEISEHCDAYTDKLGNIIAFKKGRNTPSKKVLFSAHMDETGYIITGFDDDGCIKVDSIGVSPTVSAGKTVAIRSTKDPKNPKWINGVFGLIPVHRLKDDEFNKVPDFKTLRIDIGVNKKEEAAELVELGDYVYFLSEFSEFGNYIKGKALDDRIGCYVMIEMIKKELEYDTWFSFCVQEEIGCKGSQVVAFALRPDISFILEGTTASDIGGVDDEGKVCYLGKGPAISFADGATVYDPAMLAKLTNIANDYNIKWQYKGYVAGGNDASSLQRTAGGSKVLSISAPVRYLHSRISVSDFEDVKQMALLCEAAANNLEKFCFEE